MNFIWFIIIWIVVLVLLISLLPTIAYLLSLIFNWFKPAKKLKRDPNYSISKLKLQKGFVK